MKTLNLFFEMLMRATKKENVGQISRKVDEGDEKPFELYLKKS